MPPRNTFPTVLWIFFAGHCSRLLLQGSGTHHFIIVKNPVYMPQGILIHHSLLSLDVYQTPSRFEAIFGCVYFFYISYKISL